MLIVTRIAIKVHEVEYISSHYAEYDDDNSLE